MQLNNKLILLAGFIALFVCNVVKANPTCTTSATGPSAIYDPLGVSNIFGVGSVQVTCTFVGIGSATTAYQIKLSTGVSNSFVNRNMRLMGINLLYNLYTNPSYSLVWGDGTGSTSVVSDSYTMSAGAIMKNYPVYMRIPGSQLVNAGSYADTITVNIFY